MRAVGILSTISRLYSVVRCCNTLYISLGMLYARVGRGARNHKQVLAWQIGCSGIPCDLQSSRRI